MRELVRGILTLIIAAPAVVIWAYVRPTSPSSAELLLTAVLGFVVTAGAYALATRIISARRGSASG
jgi:drug/metabolite transporter (DMT)-like permease